jgi:hypothetical protein
MASLSPRCAHCRELLGVYEPLIWKTSAEAVRTSLLRNPEISRSGGSGRVFHHACYEAIAACEAERTGTHE